MRHSREIKWLKRQLPSWIEQDLITSEQADHINAYYESQGQGSSRNIALLVGGFLGALLVGGGIILIFAYNWDNLSRLQKTILSFIPLLIAQGIYGYAFFKKNHSRVWIESTSLFLMLMVSACIALISQTYHIAGEISDFLLIWILLSIPLMYLLNASLSTLLYLYLVAQWALLNNGNIDVAFWGLIAIAVPHLYLNHKKEPGSIRNHLLAWGFALAFIVGYLGVIELEQIEYGILGTAALAVLFYFLPFPANPARTNYPAFRMVSIVAVLIIGMLLTFHVIQDPIVWEELVSGKNFTSWAGYINFGVGLAILASAGYSVYAFREKRPIDLVIASLPVVALIWIILSRSGLPWPALIIGNIYVLTLASWLIRNGIQEASLRILNTGLLFFLVWVSARFFDADWSFVVKGTLFILLGLGILGINIWVSKKEN